MSQIDGKRYIHGAGTSFVLTRTVIHDSPNQHLAAQRTQQMYGTAPFSSQIYFAL